MWPFTRSRLTEESFAYDPLAHRIFVRSQREHKQRDASDAFWDSTWKSVTVRGNLIAAIPVYVVFALAWAIVSVLIEECVECTRAIRDRVRQRRGNRYIRRARQYRPNSVL